MKTKHSLIFVLAGLALLSASLVAAVILVKTNQETRRKAVGCNGCPDNTCESGGACIATGGHACNGSTRYTCDPSRPCGQQWVNPEPNHPDCGGSGDGGGGGGGGGSGTGGVCSPVGCVEAYCRINPDGSETNACHTCGDNSRWREGGNCGNHNACGDPSNPYDNIAIAISGCSYSGSDHCGNDTCEPGETPENCPQDCGGGGLPGGGGGSANCPTDVTPYVEQIPGPHEGLQLCNAYNDSIGCLRLNLPPEYQNCPYLAEAYTDSPSQCVAHTEANLKIRRVIGNGGTICLSEVNFGNDCVVQLDIRANQPGAPAGNLIAFKPNCGNTPPPPPPPTSTPTPTPTPIYTCECSEVKMYDSNWRQITDFSQLRRGQQVYLTVSGTTDHPAGLTRGRIRINRGQWQETTQRHNGEFYITFTIPDYGDYEVEGQVYNPALGWR